MRRRLSCRSATIASGVIIREPTAHHTTLVGSMIPALTMFLNWPVCASTPQLYSSLSRTLPEITAPSAQAFSAIWRNPRRLAHDVDADAPIVTR